MASLPLAGTSKQLPGFAVVAGAASLALFAGLASGAARIISSPPKHKVSIVKAQFAPASELAAGDRVQRVLELKTGGRTRVRLAVSVRKSSPLLDPTVGLRLRVDRCSKPWRAVGTSYACAGKTTVTAVDSAALGRHGLRKLDRKQRNHLRVTLTLPESAPSALEGKSAQLVYRFS